MEKFIAAICQMDSIDNKESNLAKAAQMLQDAKGHGAKLAIFPETMNFMGRGLRRQAESIPGPTTDFFSMMAKELDMWIVTGSFPEEDESTKPRNTMVLVNPSGEICCKYSKMHMFDVEVGEVGSYRESNSTTAGDEIVICETELGKLGFAICYDLRFPELFRLMALQGAEIIIVPASFAFTTGQAHWESLLRARAIENGVYVIAANQIGQKVNMKAYGHSMAVDPWGTVIGEKPEGEGCLFVEIDRNEIARIRKQIPSLENRRGDVYRKYQ